MRHFNYIDDSIVFKVGEEQIVESEIQEILDGRFSDGEMHDGNVILSEAQDDPNEPPYMRLYLYSDTYGFQITYGAEHPTLVIENGKFVHYWDMRLLGRSTTDLYMDEDVDTKLDYTLEDMIEEEIKKNSLE